MLADRPYAWEANGPEPDRHLVDQVEVPVYETDPRLPTVNSPDGVKRLNTQVYVLWAMIVLAILAKLGVG